MTCILFAQSGYPALRGLLWPPVSHPEYCSYCAWHILWLLCVYTYFSRLQRPRGTVTFPNLIGSPRDRHCLKPHEVTIKSQVRAHSRLCSREGREATQVPWNGGRPGAHLHTHSHQSLSQCHPSPGRSLTCGLLTENHGRWSNSSSTQRWDLTWFCLICGA